MALVLLRPALLLLARLRFAGKFALLALVLVVGIGWTGRAYLQQQDAQISFSAKERVGASYLAPAANLLRSLAEARSVAIGGAVADAASVERAVAELDATDAETGDTLGTSEAWADLRPLILETVGGAPQAPADALAAYDVLAAGVTGLITQAGNASNLILDPDLDSFYVMDAIVVKLPVLIDGSGRTAAAMADGLGTAYESTGDATLQPGLEAAAAAVADAPTPAAALVLAEVAAPALDRLFATRIAGLESARNRTIIVALLAALLAVYLFAAFYVGTRDGIARLRESMHAAYEGDFSPRVAPVSRDEIGDVSETLTRTVEKMERAIAVVATLAGSTERLTRSAEELAADAGRLREAAAEADGRAASAGTAADEAGGRIGGVATGARELSAAIRDIAARTDEATMVAADAADMTRRTSDAVAELDRSSAEIGAIVQLISGIVERTNLLALNASIEAARAGDAGRGFAVVAGEVRALAEQTAEATGEIEQRVRSIQQTTGSVVVAIESILEVIGRFDDGQAAISAAVEEQSAITDQIGLDTTDAAGRAAEITTTLTHVLAAVSTTSTTAVATQAAADDLRALAAEIDSVVAGFTY